MQKLKFKKRRLILNENIFEFCIHHFEFTSLSTGYIKRISFGAQACIKYRYPTVTRSD